MALLKSTLADSDSSSPHSRELLSASPILFDQLHTLGVLEDFENTISSALYEEIRARVMDTCPGEWETQMLPSLREWFTRKALPWMAGTYGRGCTSGKIISLI